MRWLYAAVCLVIFATLANACGSSSLGNPTKGPQMSTDLRSIIEAALADAARTSGLDSAQMSVESAGSVVWPDGSLGCPAPGMAYTQALVPGYRIRIRAGDAILDYHASVRGELILCPPERATDPLPGDDRT